MVALYLGLLSFLLVITLVCVVITRKSHAEYAVELLWLQMVGIFGMLSYAGFLLASQKTVALLFDELYFISTDWLVVCMFFFVAKYTYVHLNTRILYAGIVSLAVLDSALLLINTFTEDVFSLSRAFSEKYGVQYWSADYKQPHAWHLTLCYIIVAFSFIALLMRTIKSAKLYRKMYVSILMPFMLVIAVNAYCYSLDLPFDYSVLLYAALAVCFCYYALFSMPKGLVQDILVNIVKDLHSAIICFDMRGRCLFVNELGMEMFRVRSGDGYDAFEEYYKKWQDKHWYECDSQLHWEETRMLDGEEHHFDAEYQKLMDGQFLAGFYFEFKDRTDEIKRFREEQYLATHDRLTGLYNKEYFFQKAAQIISRKPDVERYMVCVSIRNFRMIHDLFGEDTADKILVEQAAQLKFNHYEDCIYGRISAEKFAMLISKANFDPRFGVDTVGKIQYLIHDKNYKIQIFMGVYRIEDPGESPQSMFQRACMAIDSQEGEMAKTVVYYDKVMLDDIFSEKSVVSEFDRAIERKQFEMFLQPLVDAEGKLVGAEALARWIHPIQGIVSPARFIPVAEKTGLISKLDEYMWRRAAEKLREWKSRGIEDISISVNISAKDFYYMDIYNTFVELVEKYGISSRNLNIEITETAMMTDIETHMETIEKLQQYGFRIEIDDFGSGYSSLNMLKDIHADILKIDMLFLHETENKARNRIILNSIISMAKQLDMSVIAEGVETREQLDMLHEMGCPMFQGYYFSKPVCVKDFETMYF